MSRENNNLISIRDLTVSYRAGNGLFRPSKSFNAVDGVSLDIRKGETLGLVGESGCGKSTLGKAILKLIESSGGSVNYDGTDLTKLGRVSMREHRKHAQMIFQDPYSSLDPRMTVGQIIAEPLRAFKLEVHGENIQALMGTAGLGSELKSRFPREMSGGQRQRVGVARALATNPDFIVADEPLSALDVSIQAQIMNLISELKATRQLTILFISHDLRAVNHLSDRIAVMYLGRIVEIAESDELYRGPLMPYTQALLSAIPNRETKRERIILKGDVPSPQDPPSGCRFRTRCPYAIEECSTTTPELVEIRPRHFAACARISPERPTIESTSVVGMQL
ncbi:MAG: oligopeptide/dipeptide ABC transporter ATP-binding protein [Pyrinomonadaceae bacterium]